MKVLRIKKNNGVFFIVAASLLVLVAFVFAWVQARTYSPMEEALDILKQDSVSEQKGVLIFHPPGEVRANLVFYQGGLVRPSSYSVLAHLLAQEGIRVFLPQMPLDLAILDTGAFSAIQDEYRDGAAWYIGGHSLGGAAAAIHAAENPGNLGGLVLLGAYPPESADLSGLDLRVLSFHATNDSIVNLAQYNGTKHLLPPDTVYLIIEGGNHSQYGHYGLQSGDKDAVIPREAQLSMVVEGIVNVLVSR
ncbi:MAG: alpha/beta hydrolase [Clostridia bacterium]